MSEPSFPPDHRNAPLKLWRRVREFICECVGLFGEPQDLAAKHTLTFKDYKLTLTWLRAGEALLRRFLLIEAALLPPSALTSSPAREGSGSRQGRETKGEVEAAGTTDLDLTNPDAWRVSFRTISSSPASGGSGSRQSRETKGEVAECAQSCTSPSVGCAATSPASGGGSSFASNIAALSPRFRSALPLARRFEAMLRAYNNPLPFARRLAARVRKQTSFIKRMLDDAWETSRGLIPQDLHDVLAPCIDESARLLTDSS